MAEYGARKTAWPSDWTEDERCPYLRGVPEAEWADRAAEAGAAAVRGVAGAAAWEGDAPFGGGSMPAAAIGSMMTAEFVLHGWDVARATGQPLTVPEPLAAAVLAGVESIAGMGRDGGWFAAEVAGARGRVDAGPRARPVRPRPGLGALNAQRGRHAAMVLMAAVTPRSPGARRRVPSAAGASRRTRACPPGPPRAAKNRAESASIVGELVVRSPSGDPRGASPSSPRARRARRGAASRRTARDLGVEASTGTAELTRPTATARAASNVSPVRNSSWAARGSSRGSTVTEITAGTTPMRTSLNANVAPVGRHRDVARCHEPNPARARRSRDLRDHRLRRRPDPREDRGHLVDALAGGPGAAALLEVHARAEHPPGVARARPPAPRRRRAPCPGGQQLAAQLGRERVAVGGGVQGDRRHPRGDVEVHQLAHAPNLTAARAPVGASMIAVSGT